MGMVTLTGCGFQPLYQQSIENSSYEVSIATLPDREGQILKNELLVLFPKQPQAQKRYLVEPTLTFDQSSLGLRRDATAKRQTLTAILAFTLTDQENQRVVYKDHIMISGSYSVASSTDIGAVSLVASEKDTRMRLLKQAAQEVKLLVASYLNKG
jgi:hypothetical protein